MDGLTKPSGLGNGCFKMNRWKRERSLEELEERKTVLGCMQQDL